LKICTSAVLGILIALLAGAFPAMAGEWELSENGKYWTYCESPGEPVEDEWIEDNGKIYYVDARGRMKTGWVKDEDSGNKYYMGEDGAMCFNAFTKDDKYVGPDGLQVERYDTYRKAIKSGLKKATKKKKSSQAYLLFYEFYDEYLIELLAEAQQVFPNLSMEVRLDVDPVIGRDGSMVGAEHFRTFPCGEASYSALMYSVSMGYGQDRVLTAAEALSMMEQQLYLVQAYNGGKPLYIDQLLYMDITPGFERNARLIEAERNAYLVGLLPLLNKYTNGYAVWSYRNYANNPIYNSQFALGDKGWESSRGRVMEKDGSHQMRLENGGSISQEIGYWISQKIERDNHVRFTADSNFPVRLFITLGSRTEEVIVDGKGTFDLNFGKLEYGTVQFRATDELWLDNICVYNFVQDGQLYGMNGEELSCLEGIRTLNQMLGE